MQRTTTNPIRRFLVAALTCAVAGVGLAGSLYGQQNPGATAADMLPAEFGEPLLYGPIHEAFARPVGLDAEAGPIVPRRPPEDIPELPPEARPEEASADWIAGYWWWDEDRQDFVWISGVWRIAPPNMRWVAGYWIEVSGGFQWITGFWAPATATELSYYPLPPDSLEIGPNRAAPGDDYFWVPGCWEYGSSGYAWRAGYWSVVQPNWLWVPAHYVYTPRGCIFVRGYWDRPFDRRGWLFAPTYFGPSFHSGLFVNRWFTPSVVLRGNSLLAHLFLRPRQPCYFFGDYYGSRFASAGFYPWYARPASARWHDPLYTYYNWQYGRSDRNWQQRMSDQYRYLSNHQSARPPRSFAQLQLGGQASVAAGGSPALGVAVRDVISGSDPSWRAQRITDSARRATFDQTESLRQLAATRRTNETPLAGRPPERLAPGQRPSADSPWAANGSSARLRLPPLSTHTALRPSETLGPGRTTPGTGNPAVRSFAPPQLPGATNATPRTGLPSTTPRPTAPDAATRPSLPNTTPRTTTLGAAPRTLPQWPGGTNPIPRGAAVPQVVPRTTAPNVTPRSTVPQVTPRPTVPGVVPRSSVPNTTPRTTTPNVTPRSSPSNVIPRTVPQWPGSGSTVTPRATVPQVTPRATTPSVTPRPSLPNVTPRSSPSVQRPQWPGGSNVTPRSTMPSITPRSTTPSITPRSSTPSITPRSTTPSFTPRSSTPSFTPRPSVPSVTPRATVPNVTPRSGGMPSGRPSFTPPGGGFRSDAAPGGGGRGGRR